MAFASTLEKAVVVGKDDDDDKHASGSNNYRHADLVGNAAFARAVDESSSSDVEFPPGVGRTVSVESDIVGSGQGARYGRDAGRNNAQNDPSSDPELEAPGAVEETFSLSSGALGDVEESEEEAVAAEDWLEVTAAMMDGGGVTDGVLE